MDILVENIEYNQENILDLKKLGYEYIIIDKNKNIIIAKYKLFNPAYAFLIKKRKYMEKVEIHSLNDY